MTIVDIEVIAYKNEQSIIGVKDTFSSVSVGRLQLSSFDREVMVNGLES